GAPVDQFSFLAGADGNLNVVVRGESSGDAMWAPEKTAGSVALMRVPITSFTRAADEVPLGRYTELPAPKGYTFENRFVGDYLVYGTGSSWGYVDSKAERRVFVTRYANADGARSLELGHSVDRIEAMGRDAVIVGTDGKDLHFSSVSLGEEPSLGGRYT